MSKGSRSAKTAAEVEQQHCDGDLREQVWLDGTAGYVIRLDIGGFSKEEVDVRVNGTTGRVTVLGQRPAAGAAAGHVRLHRVIQLPPTADSDRVAARFDGTTLCLTVPKRPVAPAGVVMATTMEVAESTLPDTEKERAARWDRGSVVVAAAGAFALGVVVSHRIFSTSGMVEGLINGWMK